MANRIINDNDYQMIIGKIYDLYTEHDLAKRKIDCEVKI